MVTSGSGAAVRDIIHVLSRRWPGLDIRVWPVKVQGPGAAEEIAAAVRGFNALAPTPTSCSSGAAAARSRTCGRSTRSPSRAPSPSRGSRCLLRGPRDRLDHRRLRRRPARADPVGRRRARRARKGAVEDLIAQLQDSMLQSLRDRIETLARRLNYAAAHPFLQDPRRLGNSAPNASTSWPHACPTPCAAPSSAWKCACACRPASSTRSARSRSSPRLRDRREPRQNPLSRVPGQGRRRRARAPVRRRDQLRGDVMTKNPKDGNFRRLADRARRARPRTGRTATRGWRSRSPFSKKASCSPRN